MDFDSGDLCTLNLNAMVNLPSFLEPFSLPASSAASKPDCLNANFIYSGSLGSSHALWWPPHNKDREPESILLFIPGNPGVVDFYIPFLSSIHQQYDTSNLAILARAHLDHYSGIKNDADKRYSKDECLSVQVQTSIEVLDAVILTYPNTRIMVIGHSVGSWIVLQMLKSHGNSISGAFLLCPTVSNIAKTPNGKLLAPIFVSLSRRVLSSLSVLLRYLPGSLFAFIYATWPQEQLCVLRHFLSSRTSVLAALDMGAAEMKTIQQLDIAVLEQNKDKIYVYYAQRDDWVGEEKKYILRLLDSEGGSDKIAEGPVDIPHAFCISHSKIVAQQCLLWLNSILDDRIDDRS